MGIWVAPTVDRRRCILRADLFERLSVCAAQEAFALTSKPLVLRTPTRVWQHQLVGKAYHGQVSVPPKAV